MPPVVALGAAVLGGIGVTGAVSAVVAGAIGGAIVGAVIGGVTAAISGGDIGSGMLKGALTGAVTGAFSGFMQAGMAGQVATGADTVTTTGGNVIKAGTTVQAGTGVNEGLWMGVGEGGAEAAIPLSDVKTLGVEGAEIAGGAEKSMVAGQTPGATEASKSALTEAKITAWSEGGKALLTGIAEATIEPETGALTGSPVGTIESGAFEGQQGVGGKVEQFRKAVEPTAPGSQVIKAPTAVAAALTPGALAATPTAVAQAAPVSALENK